MAKLKADSINSVNLGIEAGSRKLMLREHTENGINANQNNPNGKVVIDEIDLRCFGIKGFRSKKLAFWNTVGWTNEGKSLALSKNDLRNITDLTVSLNKQNDLNNHRGEGMIASSMKDNRLGLFVIACKDKKVHLVQVRQVPGSTEKDKHQWERRDFFTTDFVYPNEEGIDDERVEIAVDSNNEYVGEVIDVTDNVIFSAGGDFDWIDQDGKKSRVSGHSYNVEEDWVMIVLAGNSVDQQTAKDPFGDAGQPGSEFPSKHYNNVINSVYKRYFRFKGVRLFSKLGIEHEKEILPISEVFKNNGYSHADCFFSGDDGKLFRRDQKRNNKEFGEVRMSTVTAKTLEPLGKDGETKEVDTNPLIKIHYLFDFWPETKNINKDGIEVIKPERNASHYKNPASTTSNFSGIVFQDEIFDMSGTERDLTPIKKWMKDFGLPYGYKFIRIFVEICDSGNGDIIQDRTRKNVEVADRPGNTISFNIDGIKTKRNTLSGGEVLKLQHFQKHIYANRPNWLIEIMRQFQPEPVSDNVYNEQIKELFNAEELKDTGKIINPPPPPPPPTKDRMCPKCEDNGIQTKYPYYLTKCSVCGHVIPKRKSTPPIPRPRKGLTDFVPSRVYVNSENVNDFALDDNFLQTAGEYNDSESTLFVNTECFILSNYIETLEQRYGQKPSEEQKQELMYVFSKRLGYILCKPLAKGMGLRNRSKEYNEYFDTYTNPHSLTVAASVLWDNSSKDTKEINDLIDSTEYGFHKNSGPDADFDSIIADNDNLVINKREFDASQGLPINTNYKDEVIS